MCLAAKAVLALICVQPSAEEAESCSATLTTQKATQHVEEVETQIWRFCLKVPDARTLDTLINALVEEETLLCLGYHRCCHHAELAKQASQCSLMTCRKPSSSSSSSPSAPG